MAIKNEIHLDVDIKKRNFNVKQKVVQNDSVVFHVRLYDNEIPVIVSNIVTFSLACVRPDDESFLAPGTLADNVITFTLGKSELDVPGKVKAAAQLYDANGRVSSIPFTFEVLEDPAGK